MVEGFATTPEPPYWAVIFTSRRRMGLSDPLGSTPSEDGYSAMAAEMEKLAASQPGYLGIESARGTDGLGLTVSYWRDEASVADWKAQARHMAAQRLGRERWYEHYVVRVAKVERAYTGPAGR